MTEDDRIETARALFERIINEFSHLEVCVNAGPLPHVDLGYELPPQAELSFPVWVHLSGDTLALSAGEFSGEWYPCSYAEVRAKYEDAIRGILSGQYRVVEYSRKGDVFKAHLQRPVNNGWRTIASWSKLRWPSFARAQRRTLQRAEGRLQE